MHPKLNQIYKFLISAHMVFFLMPPLMVLLIIGTLAQKEMGLYAATQYFFAGPLAWLLMGVLAFSLTLKFLFASVWSWQKSGIILSHLGVLILLYGGALTALTTKEGYLIIPEGGQARTVLDYHERSLVLLKDNQIVAEWGHSQLKPNAKLQSETTPEITIRDFCMNCDIQAREDELDNAFGMAAKVHLVGKDLEKQDEANISGVTFQVAGIEYVLFEGFTKPLPIEGFEIIYGKKQRRLPFDIALKDFQKIRYPGTDMAKEYSSDVIVRDGDIEWPVKIEMNKPLRYKGYTFFQSNYIERPDAADSTILAVVENKGWLFPYISTLIMALGLLIQLFIRCGTGLRRAAAIVTLGLTFMGMSSPAQAEGFNYKEFSNLPVLHEGRIKPLDSFARIHLKRFSGKETIDGQPAIVWLSEVLFDPTRATLRPIFKITHPDLRTQLKLEDKDGRLFSVDRLTEFLSQTAPQVNTLYAQNRDELETGQQALLDLHDNALSFFQILRSFSIIMPLDVELPKELAERLDGKEQVSFLDLVPYEDWIVKHAKAAADENKMAWENYSDDEMRYVSIGFTQNVIRKQNQNNHLFRIMPDLNQGAAAHNWLSPWEMIGQGAGSPHNQKILSHWKMLITAYQTQDENAWHENIQNLWALYADNNYVDHGRLQAEGYYNAWPLGGALLFVYGAAFMLLVYAVISKLPSMPQMVRGALIVTLIGVLIHALLMGLRIYILDRPPVGTLYESILFVSFVSAFVAMLVEWKQKRGLVLISGLFTTIILLLIAPYFVADGDSLDVLVAVLNTSFWLTTHVLCITIGYGVCIFAAICAHIYLFRAAMGQAQSGKLFTTIFRLSVAALFFVAFGTVLGGIWADQSWGRFWGWDPKENGALLIVLWLVWALHARHAGIFSPLGYSAAIAYLNVIVTLSWFGVNLLSVGLHSYGFISGIAYGIAAVTIVETCLIFALIMRSKMIQKRA